MSQQATFLLREERDRQFALKAVQRAPIGKEVIVRNPRRTTKQERRLRSMIKAIMGAGKEWGGRQWDSDNWREILISAYLTGKKRETGTVIEGMEGEFLIVGRRRGSELDTTEFGELMDLTLAWIDLNGVEWAEREQEQDQRPQPPPEAYE